MNNTMYQDLGSGVFCIEAMYQRQGMASCYLLQQNDAAVLIDTGTSHTVATIMELLDRQGLQPEQIRYVMPTHVHLDHAGGVGELMRQLPEAQLIVHPFGARHMIDPSRLAASATAVYGKEKFHKDFGQLRAVPEERVVEATDGFTIDLNGRQLVCLDTPGHARHHYCVYDESSNGFFTGDTFGVSYREFDNHNGQFIYAPSTPVQFDPDAWHLTIDRLLEYAPEQMYLTHYGRITDVPRKAEILHHCLDAYVELTQSISTDGRYEQLKAGLKKFYLQQLRQHDCTLPLAQQEELLSLDLEINAKGLEVWMQKQDDSAAIS